MKVSEIAEKIDQHLKRLEADPETNALHPVKKTKRFYQPGARSGGRFVYVCYVAYQNMTAISKADAEIYLAALDEGSNERHFEVLRQLEEARKLQEEK